jgi:hypothetical protein
MTSKIKVDNINKVSDDSNIIKKCGTTTTVGSGSGQTIVVDGATVTLGRCGGAVNLASGATQSGFGQTYSAVNYCTTAKTSPFTAASDIGYFVDTSSGAVTVTLPASPSAGDIVGIADLKGTFDTNAVSLCRNGSKIKGSCSNVDLKDERMATNIIYSGSDQGWISLSNTNVTCGATLKPQVYNVRYLVVAGGGGGGGFQHGSGGGAGGFRTVSCASFSVSKGTPISITVGGGGVAQGPGLSPSNGSDSVFSTITSSGGGRGVAGGAGTAGGSGAGGGSESSPQAGGAGNTPPVSPPQGNPGGNGRPSPNFGTGGGGGAGAPGANASGNTGGTGGEGAPTSIFGSAPQAPSFGTPGPAPGRYFGGGGGGGTENGSNGSGPPAGGGGSAAGPGGTAPAGTANTGGGGGGGGRGSATSGDANAGGSGGSGVVVIRHATAEGGSGGNTTFTCGSDTVRVFTGDGTFTP